MGFAEVPIDGMVGILPHSEPSLLLVARWHSLVAAILSNNSFFWAIITPEIMQVEYLKWLETVVWAYLGLAVNHPLTVVGDLHDVLVIKGVACAVAIDLLVAVAMTGL